ncbi:hypothetical protein F5148DRAFT_107012 [Russula earlei]|uniref:Uncharacterized protein n=1 Tax=Russula earlei TaxID=71964 RepID=A0ACC0U710_9AGAM|nr:hypothetical protein F5148DRAFT_107012 [Russula earlei]
MAHQGKRFPKGQGASTRRQGRYGSFRKGSRPCTLHRLHRGRKLFAEALPRRRVLYCTKGWIIGKSLTLKLKQVYGPFTVSTRRSLDLVVDRSRHVSTNRDNLENAIKFSILLSMEEKEGIVNQYGRNGTSLLHFNKDIVTMTFNGVVRGRQVSTALGTRHSRFTRTRGQDNGNAGDPCVQTCYHRSDAKRKLPRWTVSLASITNVPKLNCQPTAPPPQVLPGQTKNVERDCLSVAITKALEEALLPHKGPSLLCPTCFRRRF